MNEVLKDKLEELEKYVFELEDKVPQDREDYLKDRDKQLICERLFEIIIEATIDIIFIFIHEKKLSTPEDDENALEVLKDKNFISKDLCTRLREARRMRNIIAHKYGRINASIVFDSISQEIPRDVKEIMSVIRNNLK
ncbi:MAG: DUF86 domain-containing protein [Nanoarchaeota archaeon]